VTHRCNPLGSVRQSSDNNFGFRFTSGNDATNGRSKPRLVSSDDGRVSQPGLHRPGGPCAPSDRPDFGFDPRPRGLHAASATPSRTAPAAPGLPLL